MNTPLPNNLDAERSVIASCMCNQSALMQAVELLRPEMFYHTDNRKIFAAIAYMQGENETVDILTLCEKLKDESLEAYISEVSEKATYTNVKSLCSIIIEKYKLRKLIETCNIIMQQAGTGETTSTDIISSLDRELSTISDNSVNDASFQAGVSDALSQIESAYTGNSQAIQSGINQIDSLTGGFYPGDLCIIGARPGHGKSALMVNMLLNMARAGVPCLVFSLEMIQAALIKRMLSIRNGIDVSALRSGKLSKNNYLKLCASVNSDFTELPIHIIDNPGLNIFQIKAIAHRYHRKHGIRIIFVDYLQRIKDSGKERDKRLETGLKSTTLKDVAKVLDIPVIALAQLSRACESRTDKRPIMADLKESSDIEQDADLISFLYRPCKYEPDADRKICEFLVNKCRDGQSSIKTNLQFIEQYTHFEKREGF